MFLLTSCEPALVTPRGQLLLNAMGLVAPPISQLRTCGHLPSNKAKARRP